jgi:iron complex transport system substrate-binding protein
LQQQLPQSAHRPRVAFLEWLQPFYVGGHWVPEMIRVAGGEDVLGKVRTPSFRVHLQDIVEAEPEILLIAPCGYGAQRARDEYLSLELPEQWNAMPAVRNGRAYALEASSYFSRPGPRLVTGIEALAKLFYPAIEVPHEAKAGVLPIHAGAHARAATT